MKVSPQDVLTAFEGGNISAEHAKKILDDQGIFCGEALKETLLTLLDGIRAQDTMFALARFPRPFRNRVIVRVNELADGAEETPPTIAREDGDLLISFFQAAEDIS